MRVPPKKAELLRRAIDTWVETGQLRSDQGDELKASIEEEGVNWQKITQVAFVIALVSAVVSLVYVLADDYLLSLLYRVIYAPYPALAALFAVLAAAVYGLGWRRQVRRPGRVYSNEALLLGAGALAGSALYFLGRTLDPELSNPAPLFLGGAGLWLFLGRRLASPATWVVGLMCLVVWFGVETTHRAGGGPFWWGMNLPWRYLLFGALLAGAAIPMRRLPWPRVFAQSVYTLALLLFFLSFWLLTLFGNVGDWASWEAAGEWDFLGYSLALAAVSGLAVWLGARLGDRLLRGLGMVFFLLNLYTRFIGHGWDRMHGAIFFMVLAISFWLIGRRAEKLWEMTG